MKANNNLRLVENNSYATTGFTIQASGKMFHMVISGLYSNKPQSITREIWSNAFDAHAMVGKTDTPFDVTFPTALTPVFSCRDYGPGLAHEDMEGFYTVVGHSTKEDTNAAVGKWGVGRMSPMSYTDTFSVVSRHKGMIAYYTVQLGPDGSPQLHVLAPPSPTDEADGLEVSFPVKRDDISNFQTAASLVAYGFDVPPNVTNSKEKSFEPVKKVMQGKGYYIYDDRRMDGAYAQMGCVLYPLPRNYYSKPIVYQFDIGELEVTASREALSFGPNDPTHDAVKQKVVQVSDTIDADVQAQVNAAPSLFIAAKLSYAVERYTSNSVRLTYRGADIPKKLDIAEEYGLPHVYVGEKGYRNRTIGWGMDAECHPPHTYQIFVQDISNKKGCVRASTRIAAALPAYGKYIWIRADLSHPASKAKVDAVVADLGYPTHYVADLPDAGPTASTKSKVQLSALEQGTRITYSMDDAELKAGGYYVTMVNNDYSGHLNFMCKFVKEAGLGDRILLVPKTLSKKFLAAPQWKELEPAINEVITREAPKAVSLLSNDYSAYPFYKFNDLVGVGGTVGAFVALSKAHIDKSWVYLGMNKPQWGQVLDRLGLPLPNNDRATLHYKAILDKYPLLDLYRGGTNDSFIQYIALINNAKQE